MSTFADVDDVAARVGYVLTEQQQVAAEFLLTAATALIAVAAGKGDEWAAELDPVPTALKTVCVEAVVRVIVNPEALSEVWEEQGDERLRRTFRDTGAPTGVLELTPSEENSIRRALARGRGSGSGRVTSLADQVADWNGLTDIEVTE